MEEKVQSKQCSAEYKRIVLAAKSAYFIKQITLAKNSSKVLFQTVNKFMSLSVSSSAACSQAFCDSIAIFFSEKVEGICF